jgi:hypothetical protein
MRTPGASRIVFRMSAKYMRRGFDGLLALAEERGGRSRLTGTREGQPGPRGQFTDSTATVDSHRKAASAPAAPGGDGSSWFNGDQHGPAGLREPTG